MLRAVDGNCCQKRDLLKSIHFENHILREIFVVSQLCEKMEVKKKLAFLAFINLENTCDRVDREAMKRTGDLWSLVKSLVNHNGFR